MNDKATRQLAAKIQAVCLESPLDNYAVVKVLAAQATAIIASVRLLEFLTINKELPNAQQEVLRIMQKHIEEADKT